MIRAKPLFIAIGLATGASLPALAQTAAAPVTTETYSTTTTVITPAPSTTVVAPAPVNSEEEHGGLRNRLHDDRAMGSEDARERAGRVTSKEEEHGGLRNRIKAKKERTRERLGLGHDD